MAIAWRIAPTRCCVRTGCYHGGIRLPVREIEPADFQDIERWDGAEVFLFDLTGYAFPLAADTLDTLDEVNSPLLASNLIIGRKSLLPRFPIDIALLLLPATRFAGQPPAASKMSRHEPPGIGRWHRDQNGRFDFADRLAIDDRFGRTPKLGDDGFDEAARAGAKPLPPRTAMDATQVSVGATNGFVRSAACAAIAR